MVLYHAADLMWGARIRAEADAAGVPARPVRSGEMLDARLADSQVRGLLVDLDAPDTALALIRRLRAPDAGPAAAAVRIAAFGPHVATDLFAAARQAGADVVLARGALARRLADVLRTLEASGTPESAADE